MVQHAMVGALLGTVGLFLACLPAQGDVTVAGILTPNVHVNGCIFDPQDFFLTGVSGVDATPGPLAPGGGIPGVRKLFCLHWRE